MCKEQSLLFNTIQIVKHGHLKGMRIYVVFRRIKNFSSLCNLYIVFIEKKKIKIIKLFFFMSEQSSNDISYM